MIKAEDFKWLDRVYHLFHLGSYLCLSGALTDCFLPLTLAFSAKVICACQDACCDIHTHHRPQLCQNMNTLGQNIKEEFV